jgi:hypothetical protein
MRESKLPRQTIFLPISSVVELSFPNRNRGVFQPLGSIFRQLECDVFQIPEMLRALKMTAGDPVLVLQTVYDERRLWGRLRTVRFWTEENETGHSSPVCYRSNFARSGPTAQSRQRGSA